MADLADLASDYQDMAAAYQGLGYLESGITEPLNRFAEKMLDFSALLKHAVSHPPMSTCWRQYCGTDRSEPDHDRTFPERHP